MAHIRPFAPSDYPAIVEIANAVYVEYPETVEEARWQDEHRDPQCRWQRWVAEEDGRVVGRGSYSQWTEMYHPRKFWVDVTVHPAYQGHGIGSALYDQVIAALQPLDPLILRSYAREDMERSLRFLADRGFREEMREWESRLNVAAFDPSPYAGLEEKLASEGIVLKSLRELEDDPERNRKLYELDCELMRDVPAPDPVTDPSFEHWLDRFTSNPNLLPDAYMVAVHAGEYVGSSALWSSQASNDLYTGLTGVRRAYRRRGIATALKLRCIAYAQAHGCLVIKTWNESNNRDMLSINERLGFVRQPAWISFVKVLKQEAVSW